MAFNREIRDILRGEVQTWESQLGEHQSNGMVENGVQRIQGQFRVRRHALESRFGQRLGGHHNCLPWLVRHVGQSLNRYQVGNDGKRHTRDGKEKNLREFQNLGRESCT